MRTACTQSAYSVASLETLEHRLLLDSQVGIVSMPFDGYLSAGVYDSTDHLVRTLLARSPEQAGNVSLMWDGKDDYGRTVSVNGTYTWKALVSQVEAVDQGGPGDSVFSIEGLSQANPMSNVDMGYTVSGVAVPQTGGYTSEVGGTFAKNDNESYYGDTTLSQSFTLNDAFSASGVMFITDITTVGGRLFIGHFSSSTSDRDTIGLEFRGGDYVGTINVAGRIYTGDWWTGGMSSPLLLGARTGYLNWDYSYDPTFEADAGHDGPEGKLTVHIYNYSGIDWTGEAVLSGADRDAGLTFDSFGMGISTHASGDGDDATKTAKVYIDDVTYSGNTGVMDFSADPGWTGVGNDSDGNDYAWKQWANNDGSLYHAGFAEEGMETRRFLQDGTSVWYNNGHNPFSVTVDDKYAYFSMHQNNQDLIYRYFVRDGYPAPFAPGVEAIVVNSSAPDTITAGNQQYTAEQYRTLVSTWGVAADGYRIWVSDYRNNRVIVYDRDDGSKLGEYAITMPLGITVENSGPNSGAIWVANSGSRVSRLTFRISAGSVKISEDVSRRLSGLAGPSGVSIGGTNGNLFVGEYADGHMHVHEYSIGGAPGLVNTWGSQHNGGALADDQFRFWAWAGVAVDKDGILNVVDFHRVQRIYTEGAQAGTLYQSQFSEFSPSPLDTYDYGTNGTHRLLSNNFEYEVDPEYTGGPRAGWMGDGSWRVTGRYYYGIDPDYGMGPYQVNGAASVRRTLTDGLTQREFVYMFYGNDVVVYALDGSGQRMSAIVGAGWRGADRLGSPDFMLNGYRMLNGQYNWADANGNGMIDWTGQGSGSDGEVDWYIPMGQAGTIYGGAPWVDDSGNIWTIDGNGAIIKLALEGFDAQGNPKYNWANKTTVVAFNPQDGYGFVAKTLRIAGNGEIWALGGANPPAGLGWVNIGNYVARFDSSGNRLLLQGTQDISWYGAMAIDDNDPTPDYYAAGGTDISHVFTTDGLMVATLKFGAASAYSGGWIDQPYALGMFTHPVTGQLYVYTEEVYYGKAERYRIDNMSTIQRQEGDFSYTYAGGTTGHWELDGNLTDSAGSANGTFYGGTATYGAGRIGTAVDLDGTNDYVDLPYIADFSAYTVTAWVKATDTTLVNVISRASSNPYEGVSQQIWIGGDSKFRHYTHDGQSKTVVGTTTVQPNTWYHVAITASTGGMMRLYVNGQEEGTAQSLTGTFSFSGDRFKIGSDVFAQSGFFDGMVDDVRVYEHVLGQPDILAIYNQAVKPAITVTAGDATAAEQTADGGTFTVKRDGSGGNLTVYYTIGGTADGGLDYSAISSSVIIPNGQTSATVTVTPIDDGSVEGNETVILTLSTNANYTVGASNIATVTIVDNDTITVAPGGRWAFDSNVADYAGSHNGTYIGGWGFGSNEIHVPGVIGNALVLDGYNDYVDLPYNVSSSAYTISAWVKTSSTASGRPLNIINRIDGESMASVSQQMRININGRFEHYTNDGTGKTVTGTTVAQAGTWYYVAIVADNDGMMRLYVNGLEEGTAQSIGTLRADGDHFWVGRLIDGVAHYFAGMIDDVRVFDAPLSASQIQAIYSENSVNVVATDAGASEQGSDSGTFTVTRTSTGGALTVYYAVTGTAASGSDFSTLSGAVVIADGQASATITVSPIDDSAAERAETVILTLLPDANYAVGAQRNATVLLADNEDVVGVIATDPNAGEQGVNTGTFTINRTTSGDTLTVYYTLGGTAGNGSDFAALSGSVVIASGQTSAAVTVTPIDDSALESTETVILTLSANANYTVVAPGGAVARIADNEAVITIAATDSAAGEQGADTGTFTITRTNTYGNLTVYYAVSGTAGSGVDFSALSGSVVIADGQTSAGLTVTPIDDSIVESSETVVVTLSANAAYTVGAPGSGTVSIADDEPTVTIVATDPSAAEQGSQTGTFTITRSNSSGSLTVYFTRTGTAGSGADFSALPSSVVIANGQTSATVTVTPIDDSVADPDETVILTLSASTAYNVGTPASATVTITDNETVVNSIAFLSTDTTHQGAWKGVYGVDGYNVIAHASSYPPGVSVTPQAYGTAVWSGSNAWPQALQKLDPATDRIGACWYGLADTWSVEVALGATPRRIALYMVDVMPLVPRQQTVEVLDGTTVLDTRTVSSFGTGVYLVYQGSGTLTFRFTRTAGDNAVLSGIFFDPVVIATDGFESGSTSGGTGWSSTWSTSGGAGVVTSGVPMSPSYHLQLTGNNGVASRAVSLAGATTARLVFDWKADSFEPGDTAAVEIYNGTSWITVQTISDGQDDNAYHHSDIDLSIYGLAGSFQVRFRSLMSAADDYFYVDNLLVAK